MNRLRCTYCNYEFDGITGIRCPICGSIPIIINKSNRSLDDAVDKLKSILNKLKIKKVK